MSVSTIPDHTPRWHHSVIWIGVAAIVSVVCHLLLLPRIGPLVSPVAFLIIPIVLATLIGERWTIPIAPLVFWGCAWLFLWLNRPVVSIEVLLVTATVFTVASLIGALAGIQLRRLRTRSNSVSSARK